MVSKHSYKSNPPAVITIVFGLLYLDQERKGKKKKRQKTKGKEWKGKRRKILKHLTDKLFNKVTNLIFPFGHLLPTAFVFTFKVCVS